MLKYHREIPVSHPKREIYMQYYQDREILWDRLLGELDSEQRSEWTKAEIDKVIKSIQEYISVDYHDAKIELTNKVLRKMLDQVCRIVISLLSREELEAEYITSKLQLALRQITEQQADLS